MMPVMYNLAQHHLHATQLISWVFALLCDATFLDFARPLNNDLWCNRETLTYLTHTRFSPWILPNFVPFLVCGFCVDVCFHGYQI